MVQFIPEGWEPKRYILTPYTCNWCGKDFVIHDSVDTSPMYRSKPSRCSSCSNRLGYLAGALESEVLSQTWTPGEYKYIVTVDEMRAKYAQRAVETRTMVKELWPDMDDNELLREECIAYAVRKEIPLAREDFTETDGQLTIDGTDPREWVIAMTQAQ